MARPAQDVTDAELAVLEVIWREEPVTARRIQEVLYPDAKDSQHGTIQKLLDRLKAKKFVGCDRSVWPYKFRSVVDREELIKTGLRKTAAKLCRGSLQPLLKQLVLETNRTKKGRAFLRELLDDTDGS